MKIDTQNNLVLFIIKHKLKYLLKLAYSRRHGIRYDCLYNYNVWYASVVGTEHMTK